MLRKVIETGWICFEFCHFLWLPSPETLDKPGHSACWARSTTCQKKRTYRWGQNWDNMQKNLFIVEAFFSYIQLPLGSRRSPHLFQPRKLCEIYPCQLLHTSTSAGLVLVVKLANSSQSSHSSPWVEKEISTICVFHLNRTIAKDTCQDGRGKECKDGQDQHKAGCNWDLFPNFKWHDETDFNFDSILTSVFTSVISRFAIQCKKTHVHNTRPWD